MKSEKTAVAVLGATGIVGQRFIQLLDGHPWFEVAALVSSRRTAGRRYAEAAHWLLDTEMPAWAEGMRLLGPDDGLPCTWAFSALPGDRAGPMETGLAAKGHIVCSNASALRMDPHVPLVIPEVNAAHLGLIATQRRVREWDGAIVTAANCTTTIMTLALCPLHRAFGLKAVHAVSMQGLSGAGYPGVAALDIVGNVLPQIRGEEEKLREEPQKLLGRISDGALRETTFAVSAQCHRVPVREGHLVAVNASFARQPTVEDVKAALEKFEPHETTGLPGAPERPVRVARDPARPQPLLDSGAGRGMTVTVGRIRPSDTGDVQFVVAGHNTLRGAAGGTLLTGELLLARKREFLEHESKLGGPVQGDH